MKMNKVVKSLVRVLAVGFSCAQVLAQTPSSDLTRIEHYLDGLRTLEATFRQIDPDGRVLRGTFYLSRPGKMRLKYAPPLDQTVIADGNFLIYHNPDLDETTQLPLDSTPAQFILQKKISFQKDARVDNFKEVGGKIYLSLVKADDPEAGKMTLVFRAQPLELQEWIMSDPNGRATHVFLEDVRRDVKLDKNLFIFDRPRF
jgi:outer membrane lipoprotein-sorting protein